MLFFITGKKKKKKRYFLRNNQQKNRGHVWRVSRWYGDISHHISPFRRNDDALIGLGWVGSNFTLNKPKAKLKANPVFAKTVCTVACSCYLRFL